jgi:hypothetical protein
LATRRPFVPQTRAFGVSGSKIAGQSWGAPA